MPSVRLRSKKQIKTKKNGGASVVPKPGNAVQEKSLNRFGNQGAYCRLGEIPIEDDDDRLSGAKLRKYSKYFMCDSSVLTAEEKKLGGPAQQKLRIQKMSTALCNTSRRSPFSLANFKANPDSVSVNDLTDGTRCLLQENYFRQPFEKYYNNLGGSGPLISTAALSFHDTFYNRILPKLCGENPYLKNPANQPVFVPLTSTDGFATKLVQDEWTRDILNKFYNGGTPMYKYTQGSSLESYGIPCPQTLTELEAIAKQQNKTIDSYKMDFRFNNVLVMKKGGKNYIVKRYTRFFYKDRSDFEIKGCALPDPKLTLKKPDIELLQGNYFPNSSAYMERVIKEKKIIELIKDKNAGIFPTVKQKFERFKGDAEFQRIFKAEKATYDRLMKEQLESYMREIQSLIIDPVEADFTKKIYNEEFEFRELFTNLILTNYLINIYGNAAGPAKSFICPKHYGLLFVPSYTSNKGPYNGKSATGDVFFIQEAMHQTFDDWVKIDRTSSEMLKFMEYAEYLDNCLNYNEILPAYAQMYSKFIKYQDSPPEVWDGTKPIFIRSADCKGDNIMINSDEDWKFIDIDGMQYSRNPSNSMSQYVTKSQLGSLSPFSCIISPQLATDPIAVKNLKKLIEPDSGSPNSVLLNRLINKARLKKMFSVVDAMKKEHIPNNSGEAEYEDENAQMARELAASMKGGRRKTRKMRKMYK
jgi:hypothetical protein